MAFFSALHHRFRDAFAPNRLAIAQTFLNGDHRFRDAFDPNRLAMSQAFLAGDYGAAVEQFRRLQAEHERLRTQDRMKRKAAEALKADEIGALGATSRNINVGSDAGSVSPQLSAGGAGRVADFFSAVGDGAAHGVHGALPSGALTPVALRTGGAGDLARWTIGVEDDDWEIGARHVVAELPATHDDMVTPASALPLRHEPGAKLRAKQSGPEADLYSVRGSAGAGISAQLPRAPLIDVLTTPAIEQSTNAVRNSIPPGADGRFGNAYTDPDYLPVERSLESELGLPSGLLTAIRTRGERSNADQVSEAGARTVYQITPSTRRLVMRRYGVDPWAGPEQAARAAALLLRESHEQQGDWNVATLEYHGGTNRRNWGPRTRAYGARVGDFNGRR